MNTDKNKDWEIVRKAMEQIGEHFDNVQIFATRHESGKGTINIHMGNGNWYARYGQVKEWIVKEEEDSRQSVREENDDDAPGAV
jgi:hypothetical protein